ncbi:MAG TPA: peptidoglycan binding domain-containing protein, partial [Acidimicrobiia bacterium]|nr:peptidoglycan binding domain-containing protein [Acidimicrobiia bacterium]
MQLGKRKAGIAGVVAVMVLGGWMGASAVASAGEVAGGTVVGGVPVSGLEASELMSRLAPAARALERRPITLVVGDRQWVRSPESMGVSVDLRASAEQAFMAGRSSSFVWMMRSLGGGQQSLGWEPRVDQDRFDKAMEQLAAQVKSEASNGDFSVAGATVTVKPPTKGYELRAGPARKMLLLAALRPTSTDSLKLPVKVTNPEIDTKQQERVKQQAENILKAPIAFVHEGKTFTVAADRIAPALKVKVIDEPGKAKGSTLVLEADPEVLKEKIVAAAPEVNRPAKDATFTVAGDKVSIQPSQNGASVETGPAAAALVALGSGERRPIALTSVVQPAGLTTDAASKL